MPVWIGTSGWDYPDWGRGCFYPPGLPQCDRLAFYAVRFPAVEINSSFYGLPSADTLRRWRDSTPEDFRFTAKASRFITHMKKLVAPAIHVARFLRRFSVLGEKLSTVLFQLPPFWKFDPERLENLGIFLERQKIIPHLRVAIEFRNPSWLTKDSLAILRRHRIALVHSDPGGLRLPCIRTTDFAYLRRHGPRSGPDYSYADQALRADARWIRKQAAAGIPVFCFFNNDTGGAAVRDAARLIRRLRIPSPTRRGNSALRLARSPLDGHISMRFHLPHQNQMAEKPSRRPIDLLP